MSFKTKKWGKWGSLDARGCLPTFTSSNTGIGRGNTFSWNGCIVFCGFDSAASYVPVWCYYDPASMGWHGPYAAPAFVGNQWNSYSNLYGYQRTSMPFANYYVTFGLDTGTRAWWYFYGLNRNMEFVDFLAAVPENPGGGLTVLCLGRGIVRGEPGMLVYQSVSGSHVVYRVTPDGAESVYSSSTALSWINSWGQIWYHAAPIDDRFEWSPYNVAPAIYDAPVTEASKGSPYVAGIASITYPIADGGYVDMVVPGDDYYALASDPATPVTMPSGWTRRGLREGAAVQLDDGDIDGSSHGVALPIGMEPSRNPADGIWYSVERDTSHGATVVDLYGMDPVQPVGRAKLAATNGKEVVGWVGEYAIRNNLRLDHILPLPDRNPVGMVQPPQELDDGHIVTMTECYRRLGSTIEYLRGLKIDLRSYPVSSENWDWPGTEDGYLDGFWQVFAGREDVIVGRMPDPMFGYLGLLGQDVMIGLGIMGQSLDAAEPSPTHVLAHSCMLSGTTFATANTSSRRQLVACLSDDRLTYCETTPRIGSMPLWNARGGLVNKTAKKWTTLVNFDSIGPPGLGESNWTVWSVVPIQPCRALKQGGWLVGATLYFDPWLENDWEWTVGEREATFRDTGNGWVPAQPGFSGPFNNDPHAPILLSAYDEWTANRSLYGPDALLVYDLDGTFVECLNNENLHAPDGREVMVVGGAIPRIIYRIYRWGTYSDFAEGYGQYHRLTEDEEIQVPLYVCYDLETPQGTIAPGAGTFRGFVDMYKTADYAATSAAWRWDTVAPTMYEWEYPKTMWVPPGLSYVRGGKGGRTITPLKPGPASVRGGKLGSGHRTRL